MTKKNVTVNTGANMLKTRLIAYLERRIVLSFGARRDTLTEVLAWVRESDERAAEKEGGLGKQ